MRDSETRPSNKTRVMQMTIMTPRNRMKKKKDEEESLEIGESGERDVKDTKNW